MDAASTLLKSLCAVQDGDLLPSERFELPVTSAQEVGWKFKPLVPRNAMFAKPRNSCDITLYADKYFEAGPHTCPLVHFSAQPEQFFVTETFP